MVRPTARSITAGLVGTAFAVAAVAAASTPAEAAKTGKKGGSTTVAAPVWAPADTAAIHPGVQTYTAGGQCTANFVFTDTSGNAYVGQAAHCASTGTATETDGCDSGSLPLGTKVDFAKGGSLVSSGETVGTGTLVYSSWRAMQQNGETNADTCAYNDFALIKVDPGSLGKVNPTVPFWGGPNALNTTGTVTGDTVYSYGNSSLRAGVEALSPKQGTSVGDEGNGWSHTVYTATPGIPGDSGSAFLDSTGAALGTLSTVAIAPLAGSNGVGDLSRELAYAQTYSGIAGLTLTPGTQPFSPVL